LITGALVALLVLSAGLFAPRDASAASLPTYQQAYASCQAVVANYPALNLHCVANGTTSCGVVAYTASGGQYGNAFGYDCSTGPNAGNVCASYGPVGHRWVHATVMDGSQFDYPVTPPGSSTTYQCRYTTAALTPALNGYTYVNIQPLGQAADNTPLVAGSMVDASGKPVAADPGDVPTASSPINSNPAPQVCGGGSCVDPNSNQACGVVGGSQLCVPLPPKATQQGGSCSNGGGGTLCAGNPVPRPDPNAVPDPATQIKSSDSYQRTDTSSGASGVQIVNVYGGSGVKTSSGQKTGDVGPASSSSSGGSSGSVSGGGSCDSPPACSGDAVQCGIVREQWYAMCSAKTSADAAFKAVAGDGNGPSTFSSDSAKYGQGDVWVQPNTSQSGTTGGQANNGVYDQSGFGYSRTCPLQDIQFTSIPFVAKFSAGCDVLEDVGLVLVGFALFIAATITAGSNH